MHSLARASKHSPARVIMHSPDSAIYCILPHQSNHPPSSPMYTNKESRQFNQVIYMMHSSARTVLAALCRTTNTVLPGTPTYTYPGQPHACTTPATIKPGITLMDTPTYSAERLGNIRYACHYIQHLILTVSACSTMFIDVRIVYMYCCMHPAHNLLNCTMLICRNNMM